VDPITHGVIGLALSSFSGQAVSLDNPVSIGAAIGAMSPDIDVVTRLFFDDMFYCKHHRGFSHSWPSLIGLSGLITFGLSMFFPEMHIWQVFLWTFFGALSHTAFDILNSYGAMLIKKKWKASLLSLYDPVLSVIALFLIFYRSHTAMTLGVSAFVFFAYMGVRYKLKQNAKQNVIECFGHGYSIEEVEILPSLKAFYKWDFIVHSSSHDIVGNFNQFRKDVKVIEKLSKKDKYFKDIFMKTNLGAYFSDFTPNFHIAPFKETEQTVLKVIDLRYHYKGEFMHHAELRLDESLNVIESYFQPYTLSKRIPVLESA
jgi:inner membrane protein